MTCSTLHVQLCHPIRPPRPSLCTPLSAAHPDTSLSPSHSAPVPVSKTPAPFLSFSSLLITDIAHPSSATKFQPLCSSQYS
ncbi:hypothetical protein BDV97DRAFT_10567 [Delphinella strobiligena]|nr:hypothetical protein BDV97DRAFT_10567 [Delphinella strobiligena]